MDSAQLNKRLSDIEARLKNVERALNIKAAPSVQSDVNPWASSSAKKSAQPSVPQEPDEQRPGNWLGIIAVICFVAAAGFIIKLSIDSGWLTQTRQIGLAFLLGISLVVAGLDLKNKDREYASYLPGAGVIILYLTAFASHRYYTICSFEMALTFTVLVAALCIRIYTEIRHDFFPITAAAGAYLAPVILNLNAEAEFSLYYFLICSVAFATISAWVQSRALTLVAAYAAILLTSMIGSNLHNDPLIAIMLALHFATFAAGTYLYSRHTKRTLTAPESWSFFPALLIFYAMEYHFIARIQPGLAPWLSLAFAGALIGLYIMAKRTISSAMNSQPVILAFASIVFFHSFYLELLPDAAQPWMFVAIVACLAFAPAAWVKGRFENAYIIPSFVILGIVANEYISIFKHLMNEYNASWFIVSFATIVSLWAYVIRRGRDALGASSFGYLVLGAAHVLAIAAAHNITRDIGSLAVSASWLLYAVAVIVLAFVRRDEVMARSALFVLGFAAGKALLYDAASAPTIVRILCLLLTGVVLYGCGLFMRKVTAWNKP